VTVFDQAGNQATSACSTDLEVDTSAPALATVLQWDGGASASNALSIDAQWNGSAAPDLVTETLDIYNTADCTGAIVGTVTGANTIAGAAFQITSIDTAGNSNSVCSPAIAVDNTPPADATALAWDDTINNPTTLTNENSIIARWAPSGSPDLNTQIIRFYDDATCTGTLLETTPAL